MCLVTTNTTYGLSGGALRQMVTMQPHTTGGGMDTHTFSGASTDRKKTMHTTGLTPITAILHGSTSARQLSQ